MKLLLMAAVLPLAGQVTYQRILEAGKEPGNWLTYSGNYSAHRFSPLDAINTRNVAGLKSLWVYQVNSLQKFETTPLVVDGVMYISEPPSHVTALDTRTGRPLWKYRRMLPDDVRVCCGQVNRGVAALGDLVFVGTVDAHLVALHARTGAVHWDVAVANYKAGYSITVAPLAVKDKILVGVAGGEYGVRGFLDAYDARTGKRAWRFWTVPAEGERGHETWDGDSWKTGSATTWVTGAYDPETNLVYWGTGNPGPDWNGDVRGGDNLYSDCLLALDADTGSLKWHFQFTPHDIHDWDATEVPVLIDGEWRGRPRKLVLFPNRNAFYYVLDRMWRCARPAPCISSARPITRKASSSTAAASAASRAPRSGAPSGPWTRSPARQNGSTACSHRRGRACSPPPATWCSAPPPRARSSRSRLPPASLSGVTRLAAPPDPTR